MSENQNLNLIFGWKENDSRLKGKGFSGQKVLAFLYVSMALGLPDHLSELNMPFEKEFDLERKLERE